MTTDSLLTSIGTLGQRILILEQLLAQAEARVKELEQDPENPGYGGSE